MQEKHMIHIINDDQVLYRSPRDPEMVEIFTLGRFLVKRGGKVLTGASVRAVKVWSLFQFLLTNRGKALTAEEILDNLYPGEYYKNPYQAVRSLIHRLRRLFTDEFAAPALSANIVYTQGCYRWMENGSYWLDVDEFERYTLAAEELYNTNPTAAIKKLQKAVSLYLGEYLPECSGQKWVILARNYYQQLYIRNVIKLADLLRANRNFSEVIKLCQNALAIEYFEQKLHLYYLEALIEEGKTRQARRHYEEVSAAFYREMGLKPSAEMRQLYGRIQSADEGSYNLNLYLIHKLLIEHENTRGAFFCDPELFQYFYRLEKKRLDRSGQSACLGLLAITSRDFQRLPRERLQEAMECLSQVFRSSLRKGDVVCRSHEAQFLLLLPAVDAANARKVLLRIEESFRKNISSQDLVIHKKIMPLKAGSTAM